ncbi:MAG: hypothetical protein K9M02_22485, partial [Thiohalocapsa sp.]|nr:hypothetical protein [Thiohalocapsa sp.]
MTSVLKPGLPVGVQAPAAVRACAKAKALDSAGLEYVALAACVRRRCRMTSVLKPGLPVGVQAPAAVRACAKAKALDS